MNQLPTLQLKRDFAPLSIFCRYYYGHCSNELHPIIPPTFLRCPTRGAVSAQSHSLTIPSCPTSSNKKLFLPRVVVLWNSLPHRCFPDDFDLQNFLREMLRFPFSCGDSLIVYREQVLLAPPSISTCTMVDTSLRTFGSYGTKY